MHEAKEAESVVLRVQISLHTLAGERIAELDDEQRFRNILGDHRLGVPETNLEEMLDLYVLTPCRALLRAHVQKLREQAGFTRLDQPEGPSVWDQMPGMLAGLRRHFETAANATEQEGR